MLGVETRGWRREGRHSHLAKLFVSFSCTLTCYGSAGTLPFSLGDHTAAGTVRCVENITAQPQCLKRLKKLLSHCINLHNHTLRILYS